MKNHRFLWLRNRTTDNRKCEKARNIKEKRTIEMFSTVSKQLVALRSSASADIILRAEGASFSTRSPKPSGFGLLSLCLDKNLSPTKLKRELVFPMQGSAVWHNQIHGDRGGKQADGAQHRSVARELA